jgi:hypothetical protein
VTPSAVGRDSHSHGNIRELQMTGDPKSQCLVAEYSSGLQLIKSELVSLIALQNPHLHRSDAEQIVETVLGTSGASRFRHILNPKPALSLGAKPSEWRNGEETGLPYSSIHPNRFHGCSHDAHTAILLGAASFHALLSGGLGPILHQPGRASGNLRRNPEPSAKRRCKPDLWRIPDLERSAAG